VIIIKSPFYLLSRNVLLKHELFRIFRIGIILQAFTKKAVENYFSTTFLMLLC